MNNTRIPKLKIISGQGRGTVFVLEKEKYSCGRDASNDIVLDDDSVSPKHCEFLKDGAVCIVHNVDPGKSGVKVNHIQKDECKLKNYDILQLGKAELLYNDLELEKECTKPSSRTGIDLEQIETDILSTKHMRNISPFAEDSRPHNKVTQLAITVVVIFLAVVALSLILWLFLISYL